MTAMNLRRKRPPRMQLWTILMLVTSNFNVPQRLLSHDLHDTSKSMYPMGVDDCPGMTSWNVL
jgi:hypothetical protein